jgi:transcriptional regulator with XRE-family HTH domain
VLATNNWDIVKIGSLLKKKRKQLGFTQWDLADDILKVSTISNLETGKKPVGEKKLVYCCKKLNLSYDQLPQLTMEEEQGPSTDTVTFVFF